MDDSSFDFIKNNFYLLFYVISLVISLKYYNKYFDTALKYFPLLIAYTLFNELLGHFIRYSDKFALFEQHDFANDIIYNIYDVFYFGFFYYIFWNILKETKHRNVIRLLAFFVLAVYIISCFYQDPFEISLYYATGIASFALVAMIFIYLKKIKEWQREKYNLMFWVSTGLLIFHIIFPFLFLSGYLYAEAWYKYDFQTIIRILIVVMYSLFCIGFIISRRRAFR